MRKWFDIHYEKLEALTIEGIKVGVDIYYGQVVAREIRGLGW